MSGQAESAQSAARLEPIRVTFTRQQLETIREFAAAAIDSQETEAAGRYWQAIADRADKALAR